LQCKRFRRSEFQNLPRKNSFNDNFLQHAVGVGRAKVVSIKPSSMRVYVLAPDQRMG
jgi:hypothetical protein